MRIAIPLILLLGAVISDFVLALQFGVYQRYPWIHVLVAVAAIGWLAFELVRRFRDDGWKKAIGAAIALLVGVLLTTAYAWYTFDYSNYATTESRVVGQTIDELATLSLDNQRGESIGLLHDIAAEGNAERNTLIVLYRGWWCPYCRQELVQLQRHIDELRARDVRVVAASVDAPEDLRKMRQSSGASFEFLSDPDGRLLDLLGARHVDGSPEGGDIAQSASFLVDPRGRVLWGHLAENYRVRPKPQEILAVIDGLATSTAP